MVSFWPAIKIELQFATNIVLNMAEATELDHFQARDMVVTTNAPDGTEIKQLGCPIKFSASSLSIKSIGARLGEHSREVLAQYGYTESDINALIESKATC